MQKIVSYEELQATYSSDQIKGATGCLVRKGLSTAGGFIQTWMLREQLRLSLGEYKPVSIPGIPADHFVHVASNGIDLAYTKNAEKGASDIQTRVSIETFCDRFDIDESDVVFGVVVAECDRFSADVPVTDEVPTGIQPVEANPAPTTPQPIGPVGEKANLVFMFNQYYNLVEQAGELLKDIKKALED